MIKIARRADVEPFRVMEVLKAAYALEATSPNPAVCHLEVGEPGGRAPKSVLSAAHQHLDHHGIGYTNSLGIPELRSAIAGHYKYQYGLDLDPERVVVTAGSSAGFVLAFLSAFDVGDHVGLVEPAYPAYRNILKALGLVPVMIPGKFESRFLPSPEVLQPYVDQLDGLIVAHPNNPTGAVLSRQELNTLGSFCQQHGVRWISDEIYHGLTYDTPAETALIGPACDDVIVINSFSKYFCMTGWRLGWMIVPETLVGPIERLAQNLFISAPALSQYAALKAFEAYDEMDKRVEGYRRNRSVLMSSLPAFGFQNIVEPQGAFYIYADCSRISDDSFSLAQEILLKTRVAVTSGVDFDTRFGKKWIRLSYCAREEIVNTAVQRLRKWM